MINTVILFCCGVGISFITSYAYDLAHEKRELENKLKELEKNKEYELNILKENNNGN